MVLFVTMMLAMTATVLYKEPQLVYLTVEAKNAKYVRL